MFTIAIDPVLLRIGHLEVRWYGVMIALGVVAGLFIALREAKRKGIATDYIYDAATWAIIVGFLGARVFHILDFWDYYSQNPGEILSLRFSGLAIYGALVGGLVAVAAYSLWNKASFWKLADVAAPALPLGQALGRIGCLINGCNYGTRTTLPWGVVWTSPYSMAPINDVPRHPAQAYELLWTLVVFAVVWSMRKRFQTDGVLFLLYLAIYSAGRVFISFLREDTIALFGLRQAQVIGLAVVVIALPLACYLTRRRTVQIVEGE